MFCNSGPEKKGYNSKLLKSVSIKTELLYFLKTLITSVTLPKGKTKRKIIPPICMIIL